MLTVCNELLARPIMVFNVVVTEDEIMKFKKGGGLKDVTEKSRASATIDLLSLFRKKIVMQI